MAQRFKKPAKIKTNPLKSWRWISLLFVLLPFSYLLVHTYYHKLKPHYVHQTIELPSLDDESTPTSAEEDGGWKTITTKSGDTLGRLFNQCGLSQQTLQTILTNNPYAKNLTNIKTNQQIKFLIREQILEKIIFPLNATEFILVSHQNNQYNTKIKARAMDSHEEFITATVKGSLYGTAQQAKIPYKLIQQMMTIFNWEINFSKDIHSGDQFTILYEALYVDDSLVSTGDIIAVTYTTRDKIYKAIRHTNEFGDYDYYTPEGNSMKKAFSRYPIQFSHISSTFSLSRYHPVLHYARPHKGVDLAAPLGTPIHATGDGYIQTIGRQNDYGNMVKLAHNKTYSSVYGHLLKFQKGLSRGDHVKRGQIIGYVGQSGLATGPHCHYEFHINHQPKNPTTVKLPHAAPISGRERAAFQAKANQILASLKLYEAGNLAAASGKNTKMTG